MTAKKTRKDIVKSLGREFDSADLDQRGDAVWMRATMANCLFALERDDEATEHENEFMRLAAGVGWMLETYEGGKASVLAERTT